MSISDDFLTFFIIFVRIIKNLGIMCRKQSKKVQSQEEMSDLENYQSKARYRKALSLWFMRGSMVIVVIIAIIVGFCDLKNWVNVLCTIIMSLATSTFAGSMVSYFVDIPGIIDGFRSMILSTLSSDSYIASLPNERLQSIREQTIKLLHKDADRVPDGLLKLDTAMCDLLEKPYYSFFTESVVCHKKADFASSHKLFLESIGKSVPADSDNLFSGITGDFNVKNVEIDFEIVNSVGTRPAEANIGLRKSMNLSESCKIEDVFAITLFEVTIDDSIPTNLTAVINYYRRRSASSSNPETMTYDSSLSLSSDEQSTKITKENIKDFCSEDAWKYIYLDSDSFKDLLVEFQDRVKVKIKYTQILPNADNHFTRRLRYSTKQYLLLYSSEDNVQLHGQVLGTKVDQERISIMQSDKKHITIQCRDWLLPGNGTFVVSDDK